MIILEIAIPLVFLAFFEILAAVPFAYVALAMEKQYAGLYKTNHRWALTIILFEAVLCLGALLAVTYWTAGAWSSYLGIGS